MPTRARSAAGLTLLVCTLLVGAGVTLVRRAPGDAAGSRARIAAAPLVPIGEATAAAGGDVAVRLQGTLVAMPPVVTGAGQPLALQVVVVDAVAEEPPARHAAPAQLFLTDGDSLVQVAAADVDPAFLPLVAAGRADAEGRLPPDLRVHLATDLRAPDTPGAHVAVHGIEATSAVLAHGRLVLQEGVPTLLPPAGAASLVLTTMSAAEVDRERMRAVRRRLALGWMLVGAGALGALGAAVVAARR